MGSDGKRQLTALRKTKYLGSHPAASGQVDDVDLEFYADEILLKRGRSNVLGRIAWSSVVELIADDHESLERSLTGPRLMLLGAMAFVARKETTISYLVIRDHRGDWVFAVPKITRMELRSGLTALQRFVPAHPAAVPAAPAMSNSSVRSPKERLEQLASLFADGLIDEAEFAQKRAAILAEL